MSHQATQRTASPVESTSGDSMLDLNDLFSEAFSDLIAAPNVADFAVGHFDNGEDGDIVLPIKLLLDSALERFQDFARLTIDADDDQVGVSADLDAEPTKRGSDLLDNALMPLLAASSIAKFAETHDVDGAGNILLPVSDEWIALTIT